MNDDFNTPMAIAVLFDLATEVNRAHSPVLARQLKKLGAVVGLLEREALAFLQGGASASGEDDMIAAQIAARQQAKQDKNFAQADAIRKALLEQGIVLEDKPGGLTEWRRA
jgi:cysteinyl-tRNA synthetase